MAFLPADRPAPAALATLSGLGIGFALAGTAGTHPQLAHLWVGAAVLFWTAAALWPRWARPAFVAGLACFLVWHVGGMIVSRPTPVLVVQPQWSWH